MEIKDILEAIIYGSLFFLNKRKSNVRLKIDSIELNRA